jgi:hypothetical protein
MTLDDLAQTLEEVRALDDPRTDPQRPYTAEYSHLAERWDEIAPDGARYRILWKEDRPDGVAMREGSTKNLYVARNLAQGRSVHPRTVAGLAWVQLAREDEEPTTVDVWARGYWVEPHARTKKGVPPRRPQS